MKDTELIRAKSFGIAAVAYSFNDLVRCECHRRHRFISLDTIRVSREEVCLPSFDVVNCLLAICFGEDT